MGSCTDGQHAGASMTGIRLLRITMCTLLFCGAPSRVVSSSPTDARADKSVVQSLGFVVYCGQDFGVVDLQNGGNSGINLRNGSVLWKALPGRISEVGPVGADDAVAVISGMYYGIFGFSRATGELLWQKDLGDKSNVLASDGRYFYVDRRSEPGVMAIDSRTGKTAWISDVGGGEAYQVHDHVLYSTAFALDLRARKLLHKWPDDLVVYSIAVWDGRVVLGDNKGDLTLYNSEFKYQNRLRAGETMVMELAANENGILASLEAKKLGQRGTITFLSWDGERKWSLPGFEFGLDFAQFALAGKNAIIIENVGRDEAGVMHERLVSRSLATGGIKWTSPVGSYGGPPGVCGDRFFVDDGDGHIRGFKTSDGSASDGG